jgi:hypothetical protein
VNGSRACGLTESDMHALASAGIGGMRTFPHACQFVRALRWNPPRRTTRVRGCRRPTSRTRPAQKRAVQGQPCVDCGAVTPRQIADHVDPLVVEHYRTGTIGKARQTAIDAVQPHCPTCSAMQGGQLSSQVRPTAHQRCPLSAREGHDRVVHLGWGNDV